MHFVAWPSVTYVMNPLNGMMHQIRALLDSGANLSLINNDVARKMGLPRHTVNININVAGGGVVTRHTKEVSFQLVSMNKSFVSKPTYAVTPSSVGNPFNRIDFNTERHAYLEGLKHEGARV